MTPREKERLILKAEIFKAMGQPTRLRIIELLKAKEMQAGEIAVMLDTDATSVSKHLSVLRTCGILSSHKAGLRVYYRLMIPQLEALMRCVEEGRVGRIKEQRTAGRENFHTCGSPDCEHEF